MIETCTSRRDTMIASRESLTARTSGPKTVSIEGGWGAGGGGGGGGGGDGKFGSKKGPVDTSVFICGDVKGVNGEKSV